MYLKSVLDGLRFGELTQLSVGGQAAGVVNATNYPILATHINAAMTALYARFLLKEGEESVPLVLGTYDYSITATDSLKIQRIYGDSGYEFSVNDLNSSMSFITQSTRKFRVPTVIVDKPTDLPSDLVTDALRVVYRANHFAIDTDATGFMDEEDVFLELPDAFLDPLLFYVASRMTNSLDMVGQSRQLHVGNNYFSKYEASCRQLEMSNLAMDMGSQSDRLTAKGWV